jgi:localization factor PodJL
MRRHVLSNLDDLDLDARELAKSAAQRAGVSLEEWAASILAAQAGGQTPPPVMKPSENEFDAIVARLARTARPQPARNYDALMAAIDTENERQSQDQASRTNVALQSMVGWIEQTEERLNETTRAAADHQDRMATALAQALSTLKKRLDSVEQQAATEYEAQADTAAMSDALTDLRTDVSRLTERLDKPDATWMPALGNIRIEIERLRASLDGLATREEVGALDHAMKDIVREIGHASPSKDLLVLAQSTAALYRQVQVLSDDINEGLHGRISGEIEILKAKIDAMAETGVDRSVIDFLSSQIVDMRQDLANRAEPRQIERLSEEVTALGRQIADLRLHQVGRADFAALKTSLENVCAALQHSVAVQEASDVPERLNSLSENLAALASRPMPEPADLTPVTDQLAVLTEKMESLTDSRFEQADALTEMIGRLSAQVQAVAKEAPSHEPLLRRFDKVEQSLQEVGQRADTTKVEEMLRSIDEKLERAPAQPPGLDALERQIMSLAERLGSKSDGALQKTLDEATGHLRNIQNEAAGIAERAARAALKEIQPSLPDAGDLDALKQGFVELKALQTRSDKKTQETLRAVNSALETLVARFPEQTIVHRAHTNAQALPAMATEPLAPADRLEAAVRRLHTAALSQIEEVASNTPAVEAPKTGEPVIETSAVVDDADLGTMRAGFIAAARRAAQAATPESASSSPTSQRLVDKEYGAGSPPPCGKGQDGGVSSGLDQFGANTPTPNSSPQGGGGLPAHRELAPQDASSAIEDISEPAEDLEAASAPSLFERIRRSFDAHRRPLLFGIGLLILAAGTAQILSSSQISTSLALSPSTETPQTAPAVEPKPNQPSEQTGSVTPPSEKADLFQPASMAAVAADPVLPGAGKFLIDPATVGEIPAQAPASLRQAAAAGDAAALYEIASRAAEGRGLPQDMILALHLYERAAQAGLPPAQERFAMLLEKGIGTTRDLKQAIIWYERAAQGGNIRAMHNLATLLASGINGKPDYAVALRWYSEAAEAGLRDSQFNMGVLLARGIGTRQDLTKAYKWFALAAAQGDADAAKKRDELTGRLSAGDLATAKAATDQWRPRPVDPTANETSAPVTGQTAALDRTEGKRS